MALSRATQLRAYREAMGAEAARRQVQAARELRECCNSAKVEPHAPGCDRARWQRRQRAWQR